jgi:hypothetical protein
VRIPADQINEMLKHAHTHRCLYCKTAWCCETVLCKDIPKIVCKACAIPVKMRARQEAADKKILLERESGFTPNIFEVANELNAALWVNQWHEKFQSDTSWS